MFICNWTCISLASYLLDDVFTVIRAIGLLVEIETYQLAERLEVYVRAYVRACVRMCVYTCV